MLPSLAADIGLSMEDQGALAKWQSDGSDTYNKNTRAAVARVQKEIVRTLKSEPHVLGEEDTLEPDRADMLKKGCTDEATNLQIEKFRWCSYCVKENLDDQDSD